MGFVDHDGGAVATGLLAGHVVVTRSQQLPGIEEDQAGAHLPLRELVERREPRNG
jgi:hypothetical protein